MARPQEGVPTCDLCEDEGAENFCSQCGYSFCNLCCEAVHEEEGRRDHTISRIAQAAATKQTPSQSASAAQPPKMTQVNSAAGALKAHSSLDHSASQPLSDSSSIGADASSSPALVVNLPADLEEVRGTSATQPTASHPHTLSVPADIQEPSVPMGHQPPSSLAPQPSTWFSSRLEDRPSAALPPSSLRSSFSEQPRGWEDRNLNVSTMRATLSDAHSYSALSSGGVAPAPNPTGIRGGQQSDPMRMSMNDIDILTNTTSLYSSQSSSNAKTSIALQDPKRVTLNDIVNAEWPWEKPSVPQPLSATEARSAAISAPKETPSIPKCGLGVRLRYSTKGELSVAAILEGGAAAQSRRLEVGDLILQVDGISTVGKSIQDVSKLFVGDENTIANLVIHRDEEGVMEVVIQRKTFDSKFLNRHGASAPNHATPSELSIPQSLSSTAERPMSMSVPASPLSAPTSAPGNSALGALATFRGAGHEPAPQPHATSGPLSLGTRSSFAHLPRAEEEMNPSVCQPLSTRSSFSQIPLGSVPSDIEKVLQQLQATSLALKAEKKALDPSIPDSPATAQPPLVRDPPAQADQAANSSTCQTEEPLCTSTSRSAIDMKAAGSGTSETPAIAPLSPAPQEMMDHAATAPEAPSVFISEPPAHSPELLSRESLSPSQLASRSLSPAELAAPQPLSSEAPSQTLSPADPQPQSKTVSPAAQSPISAEDTVPLVLSTEDSENTGDEKKSVREAEEPQELQPQQLSPPVLEEDAAPDAKGSKVEGITDTEVARQPQSPSEASNSQKDDGISTKNKPQGEVSAPEPNSPKGHRGAEASAVLILGSPAKIAEAIEEKISSDAKPSTSEQLRLSDDLPLSPEPAQVVYSAQHLKSSTSEAEDKENNDANQMEPSAKGSGEEDMNSKVAMGSSVDGEGSQPQSAALSACGEGSVDGAMSARFTVLSESPPREQETSELAAPQPVNANVLQPRSSVGAQHQEGGQSTAPSASQPRPTHQVPKPSAAVFAIPQDPFKVLIEGWLNKETTSLFASKKRWCRVKPGVFTYSHKKEDQAPTTIDLSTVKGLNIDQGKKHQLLTLLCAERNYTFYHSDKTQIFQWLKAIKEAMPKGNPLALSPAASQPEGEADPSPCTGGLGSLTEYMRTSSGQLIPRGQLPAPVALEDPRGHSGSQSAASTIDVAANVDPRPVNCQNLNVNINPASRNGLRPNSKRNCPISNTRRSRPKGCQTLAN